MKRAGAPPALCPFAPAAAALILLAACAAPRPAPERAFYDLGRPAAEAPAAASLPMRVSASLPAWLDNGDIAFRLVYDDPSRLRHYAGSRWAGRPSQLVAARLGARFAGGKGRCSLHVELAEFSQHFASASASTFELAGRWQIAGAGGERLAGAAIVLSEGAGADAPAGVKAAARLVDRLAAEIATAAGSLSACGT